jgi:cell fate (sporulation/competence/biofilm development) regulator YlbF (YheA/YmcA/DUF963 family)
MEKTPFDMARELAQALLESKEGMAVNDARYVFDGDEEAQKLLFGYTGARRSLESRIQNGQIEDEDIDAEAAKLEEMAKELNANKVIADMMNAENSFQQYINSVMNVFNATLSGDENKGGCSGNCGGCSGCH